MRRCHFTGQFQVGYGKDSLLRITGDPPALPFAGNRLKIEFALPWFKQPELTRYRTWMEGLDEDWSDWTNETDREFMNLPPGDYRFHVQARNFLEQESEKTVYSFTILPPWWKTWWAISLFCMPVIGIFIGFLRYEIRRLNARAKALRQKEMDSLKIKLYTNITHEFRTPLTVIMGMADNIKGHVQERKLISRNSRKLLHLINEMLDLSRFDAGAMKLNNRQADIISFLNYLTESFYSMAKEKDIKLVFYPEESSLVMDYDETKLQHIVYNLLSNAIKFTYEQGKVILHARKTDRASQAVCQLKVKDTGKGIPEESLPHIFDRFYQVDDSMTRRGEGTGIGLALTREFVELMGGSIKVNSTLGKGSEFTVWLPIRNEAPLQAPEDGRIEMRQDFEDEAETLPEEERKFLPVNNGLPVLLIVEDYRDVVTYFCPGTYHR